jgi:hypothetical protein
LTKLSCRSRSPIAAPVAAFGAMKEIQISRNEIQILRNEIQARRNKIQIRRNEIQIQDPSVSFAESNLFKDLRRPDDATALCAASGLSARALAPGSRSFCLLSDRMEKGWRRFGRGRLDAIGPDPAAASLAAKRGTVAL